jgi:hypothetical protein
LCSQADVPLYFFESVLKWAAASSKAGVNFSSDCQTWDKYLTELSFRYKMEQLQPIQKSILLSDGITVMPGTCFNFLDQIRSLLDDQWLVTQENCLFSFKDPCAIQMVSDVRGDLNQSGFWYETQRAQCTTCSDFFAPLVVFVDSTPVDMYGKVNVEPVMFTGGSG